MKRDLPIVFRKAALGDALQLAVLHEACFGGCGYVVIPPMDQLADHFEEAVRLSNDTGSYPFIVATKGEKIVGFVVAEYNRQKPYQAYIGTIDVDPGCRREHIGRDLLLKIEENIDRANRGRVPVKITAHVHARNTASQKLFESMGYRTTTRESGFYSRTQDAWVFLKEHVPSPRPSL